MKREYRVVWQNKNCTMSRPLPTLDDAKSYARILTTEDKKRASIQTREVTEWEDLDVRDSADQSQRG